MALTLGYVLYWRHRKRSLLRLGDRDLIDELMKSCQRTGGSLLGVPVKDTIKVVDKKGNVINTPDRKTLWAIQTPQVFEKEVIMRAYNKAKEDHYLPPFPQTSG